MGEQQLMLLWLQIIAMLERGCQTPVELPDKISRDWFGWVVSCPQESELTHVQCIEALATDELNGSSLVDTLPQQVCPAKKLETLFKILHTSFRLSGTTTVHAAMCTTSLAAFMQ